MLHRTIIQHTHRVPASDGPAGDGRAVARQLDAVLLLAGFKASGELLRHVSGLGAPVALDLAVEVVGAVREIVGDDVEHNPYFKNFPRGVPDTTAFWLRSLRLALLDDGGHPPAVAGGALDLLALPGYGRVQHTYEELLAAHDELIPSWKDRVTVLHLGGTAEQEGRALYLSLASSPVPLHETDLDLLAELVTLGLDGEHPEPAPVRENRAVVNAARLAAGRPLVGVDTVTDVLRLACRASGGDVTLREATRFRSLRRPQRRALMAALDAVVGRSPAALGDVPAYRRRWQRLGERLHPHEHAAFPHARDVFAVARGERDVRSSAGEVELAFAAGDVPGAVRLLAGAPGTLLRAVDRVLRSSGPDDVADVLDTVGSVLGRVSGRVLCSVREHLVNRTAPEPARVFTNRAQRSWVTSDDRAPLDPVAVDRLVALLDAELLRRLPAHRHLVVDPDVLAVALPLSDKGTSDGFAVLPRGSVSPVSGELLRFFLYWRQHERRTDYDLSALLLDEDFGFLGQLSWTNYRHGNAYYSGDITDAPDGATEFIDIPLDTVSAHYLVPQVNYYAGEKFAEAAESSFGFMTRDLDQRGLPYEAATVRMRSEVRGAGNVALPVAFSRDGDGAWTAKWLHLYLRGQSLGNRVEEHRASTELLVRAVMGRRYLSVGDLVELLRAKADKYTVWTPDDVSDEPAFDGPVTYIGIERPEGLPGGSEVFTLATLKNLVPE